MLNTMFAWYVEQTLRGKYITIVFRQSIPPSDSDTLTLNDAEDATRLTSWLTGDNFILTEVKAYASPGNVQLTILPDSDNTKQFKVDAFPQAVSTPISPPKLVETNLAIDYINEAQSNNLYLVFGAFRISETNMAKFTLLSELIPTSLENIDLQTLAAQKLLYNNYYQNNAIMQQNNIMILQLNELIRVGGGVLFNLPPSVVMPPSIYFPPDMGSMPEFYYTPPSAAAREAAEKKEFCKRR